MVVVLLCGVVLSCSMDQVIVQGQKVVRKCFMYRPLLWLKLYPEVGVSVLTGAGLVYSLAESWFSGGKVAS